VRPGDDSALSHNLFIHDVVKAFPVSRPGEHASRSNEYARFSLLETAIVCTVAGGHGDDQQDEERGMPGTERAAS